MGSKRLLGPALGIIGTAVMWVLLFGWAPAKAVTNSYVQTNLASDNGVPGTKIDKNLINPWGVAFFPGNPFWVNDQGTAVSELLDGKSNSLGTPFGIPSSGVIPSGPTGIVANNPPTAFAVNGSPAFFIFDGLDGTITAWNSGPKAKIMVNNSATAKYTGLAMATSGGKPFLYAANSFGGVDVFDGNFKPKPGGFVDSKIPAGLHPFGIANIGGNLLVTYAHQFVAGGVVDEFTPAGVLIRQFAADTTGKQLNQPWAVAIAPPSFGLFSNDVLIGNFGDGSISAYSSTGVFMGQLQSKGATLKIDGLWALTPVDIPMPPPGATNPNAVYFTAGPNGQAHGLFGYITSAGGTPPTPTPTRRPTPTHTRRPTPTPTKRIGPTPTHTRHPTPTPTRKAGPTGSPTKKAAATPTKYVGRTPTATPTYYPWY